MQIHHAIITDQESSFRIVAVPGPVMADRTQAERTVQFLQTRLTELPIALVTRNEDGTPAAYYGRGDLAVRLLRLPTTAVRWDVLPLA
jgi:2-polyprenyl-6-methoxyphenol hydroxylase-like FAD-dependent oxidoreductase